MSDQEWRPRDGGCRAWLVVVASFMINGLVMGVDTAESVLYVALMQYNANNGTPIEASKAALVFSLGTGINFLLAPLGGVLADKAGFRVAGFVGSCMVAISLLASSWLLHVVPALYFTFSVVFGIGGGMIAVTTLTVLGFHFSKHLGLVNGIVTSSCSIFGALYSPFVKFLLTVMDLSQVLRVMAAILFTTSLLSIVFKIPSGAPRDIENSDHFINYENWKNKKYIIWCLCLPFIMFGVIVQYVHIVSVGEVNFPKEDSNILPILLNISGVSRIVTGIISDHPSLNAVQFVQVSFFLTGLMTIALPLVTNWIGLQVLVFFLGIVNGAFWSTLGSIATELCGVSGASQALGFMFGISAVGCIAGPPIAGYLFQVTHSYFQPMLVSGVVVIVGALLSTAIHFVKPKRI